MILACAQDDCTAFWWILVASAILVSPFLLIYYITKR